MKSTLILFFLFVSVQLFAQTPAAVTQPDQTLAARFQGMKANSQTFKEYKVIKETVLDNEWRIALDSVKGIRNLLRQSIATVARLEGELKNIQSALKEKEESTAKIEHDASHINFFGMDFHKAAFIGLVILVFGGLVLLLVLITGRLKIMFRVMKEKNESLDLLGHEFEDYKHKMLEKQIKLSRELQNERNKLQELKRA